MAHAQGSTGLDLGLPSISCTFFLTYLLIARFRWMMNVER